MTPLRRPLVLLGLLGALALAGPWLAPHDPGATHRGYWHAPPMWPQVSDGFAIHPVVLADRLQQRFVVDRSRTLGWPWGSTEEPVFLLGADRDGRDVLSRVLAGARISSALASSRCSVPPPSEPRPARSPAPAAARSTTS